jgi:hypothetical protein
LPTAGIRSAGAVTWRARPLLLPGVAVLGHLAVGHSDREAQALRIFPGTETTLAVPAIGATAITTLDVIGGDPTLTRAVPGINLSECSLATRHGAGWARVVSAGLLGRWAEGSFFSPVLG